MMGIFVRQYKEHLRRSIKEVKCQSSLPSGKGIYISFFFFVIYTLAPPFSMTAENIQKLLSFIYIYIRSRGQIRSNIVLVDERAYWTAHNGLVPDFSFHTEVISKTSSH